MHLNLARFRASDSARFSNSHGTLTSWIVLKNMLKYVKTTCRFVNIARKTEIETVKSLFFSLFYKSFPIQIGLEQLSSSIRWRVMAI